MLQFIIIQYINTRHDLFTTYGICTYCNIITLSKNKWLLLLLQMINTYDSRHIHKMFLKVHKQQIIWKAKGTDFV